MKSKIIIFLVFLVVIVLIAGFVLYRNKIIFSNQKQQISHEFDGSFKSVANNIMTASGSFLSTDGVTRSDTQDNVQILISPQTRITKTSFAMPTAEELKKNNGMFEPEKLPKTTTVVSVDDLKNDADMGYGIGIEVKSAGDKNIIGLKSFSATEINYIIPSIPK